ncbi:MAG: alpha-N-acetylglucosaminidase [Bacteroidetes bacterium]|nr:alpha-N-acetylglucosaminidase [Bacteroidota bacterium]MBU1113595.1 alpha-N-acetylglucosaminidase [Bacteroidota bacterium]MBU1796971.1 alpha-N-acetylglucosaminidase [Bacteroidota bacterium]
MSNIDKIQIDNKEENVKSAEELIKRILPDYYNSFLVTINNNTEKDYFHIRSNAGLIEIEANNPISIASGLYWYLKYYCNCHISWTGDQLKLPKELPLPVEEIAHKANFDFRYYLNYCTFSYSMPWWNWERWEREIDWMALHGINLALAIVGQEAVWQNLMRAHNFSEQQIFEFLPGPAYLAWGWLGNFDGWGGPTTQNWIDDQKELQKKIINRLTELGITPALQAFTGRVPKYFKEKYPNAKIDQLPGWYGYEGVYFLDPAEPLFKELSKQFIQEQTKLYGNYHFFAGDVFHEIESPNENSNYLNRIYKGIQEGLLYADSQSHWVLQSWSIRDENIDILDENHVIILDLYCDSEPKWKKTNAFHGHPWVWNIINNFGGRSGLGGKLELIANEIPKALIHPNKGKLVGIGFAPEGIGYNPIIYDLLAEMNWRNKINNLENWIFDFACRRYGYCSNNIKNAWKNLLTTVYSGPKSYPPLETIICAYPSLTIEKAGSNGSTQMYYSNKVLLEALQLLLKDKNELSDSETYVHDIVDITRQICANLANEMYVDLVQSIKQKEIATFNQIVNRLFQLFEDLDNMLSSNKRFSLGTWLNGAKAKAKDHHDLKLLEWNARRQITLWSSPEIHEFHDYANKQWGGLIKDYYLPRWKMFVEFQRDCLLHNKEFDEISFKKKTLDWAEEWSNKNDEFEDANGENSILLAETLLNKYFI